MSSEVDQGELEELVVQAAGGDTAAWRALWDDLEPWLERVVGNPRFLGRVGQRDDDRTNIIVEIMARLRVDDFARLRLYVETRRTSPRLKFKTWLRIVAKRVGLDYLRGHESKLPTERPATPNRGTALELLRHAAATVPEPQLSALERWTEGASYDEIARELELDGTAAAETLVRAALERLRQRLRKDKPNV